ncbi:hypothetical protein ACERII_13260 [Evansella sp. AB-rgal1]|uniref:hypothetical protein n=1 Tax=Evansella sp. AB-rgal1 TaxID=3242696 RepID=UPI00359E912C
MKEVRFASIYFLKVGFFVLTILLFFVVGGCQQQSKTPAQADQGQGSPTNVTEEGSSPGSNTEKTEEGVVIPAIQLPKRTSSTESMDMIGLIVYQGRIYTQTAAQMEESYVEDLKGEKLGTTKPTIDEWSKQDDYAVEFASSIGTTEVYSVKGYDKEFRIMSYGKYDGRVYAEFYETLNGITVYSGEDVFGKLHLFDRITSAKYQSYSNWNYDNNKLHSLENLELINTFVKKLNHTTPYTYEQVRSEVESQRNDPSFRQMILSVEDGTSVEIVLYKSGLISYGYGGVFFKMDDELFEEVWSEMPIN